MQATDPSGRLHLSATLTRPPAFKDADWKQPLHRRVLQMQRDVLQSVSANEPPLPADELGFMVTAESASEAHRTTADRKERLR